MSLNHEFFMLPSTKTEMLRAFQQRFLEDGILKRYKNWDEVPRPIDLDVDRAAGDILSDFYLKNRHNAVRIHDRFILGRLRKFNQINTFYNGFIPCVGLNYYGYTVIPCDSIPALLNVLKKSPYRLFYIPLISLCQNAQKNQNDILHAGI